MLTVEADKAADREKADEHAGTLSKTVLPSRKRLDEGYKLAQQRDLSVPDPESLWTMLVDTATVEVLEPSNTRWRASTPQTFCRLPWRCVAPGECPLRLNGRQNPTE
jgi:hypothetical protein